MSVYEQIAEERLIDDPVEHFVTNENGYFAYSQSGRALAIVHAHSIQPPIDNADDYQTFLWVETVDAFFLLRQRIVNAEPQAWSIVREIVPYQRHNFFYHFIDVLAEYLDGTIEDR